MSHNTSIGESPALVVKRSHLAAAWSVRILHRLIRRSGYAQKRSNCRRKTGRPGPLAGVYSANVYTSKARARDFFEGTARMNPSMLAQSHAGSWFLCFGSSDGKPG